MAKKKVERPKPPEASPDPFRSEEPPEEFAKAPPEALPEALPEESAEKEAAPKRKAPDKGTFAESILNLPDPFRPRHLTEAIKLYAAEHNYSAEVLAKVDPHKFGREHGLPNPLKRFRVTGAKKGVALEPAEFDAVDASEGIRQYVLLRGIPEGDSHLYRFKAFLLDY